MKSSISYNSKIALLAFIFFLFFGLFKFWPHLFVSGKVLCNDGDGPPVVGLMAEFIDHFRHEGLVLLKGDTYVPRLMRISDGQALSPITTLWKIDWILTGSFFGPEKIFEVNAFAGFVLVGVCAYFLLVGVGISPIIAFLGALILTHAGIITRIYSAHITLGIFFLPILLSLLAVKAGKDPSTKRILALGPLQALNFIYNEYYGFYGVFFAAVIFIGYYLLNNVSAKPQFHLRVFGRYLLSTVCLFLLLCVNYPQIIWTEKVLPHFQSVSSSVLDINRARDFANFIQFSNGPKDIIGLFRSPISDALGVFSDGVNIVYRVGSVLPFLILVGLFMFGLKYLQGRSSQSNKRLFWELVIWVTAGILMILFSISPDFSKVSLLPIIYKIAPMFRSNDRWLLYFTISIFVAGFLVVESVAREMRMFKKTGRNKIKQILLVVLLGLVFVDFPAHSFIHPFKAVDLPRNKGFEKLRSEDWGFLLSLPAPSEYTYDQSYYYSIHRKPLMQVWPKSQNDQARVSNVLSSLNSLDIDVLSQLNKLGLTYVSLLKENTDWIIFKNKMSMKFSIIYEDDSLLIWKAKDIFEVDADELRVFYGLPELQFPFKQ